MRVFDSLLSVKPTGELQPMLATSWSADAAGEVWTVQLRTGVRWHVGTSFSANDVIYSLKWMAKPGNGLKANVGLVDVEHVKKTGPNTVV